MKILDLLLILLINIIYIASCTVYRVTGITSYLNIRSGPGTNYSIVGSLSNNNVIYGNKYNNQWIKFYKGYVSADYLTILSSGTRYKTTADLNFRVGPSTSYSILTTLGKNTEVYRYGVDPFNTSWSVTNRGYASSEYLMYVCSTTVKKTTTTKRKTTTTTKKTIVPTATNAMSLANSLLVYEEGTNPKGVCVPYIDSLGYPTIGYGELCKEYTVSTLAQANAACSAYLNGCSDAKARQWLKEAIEEKSSCIKDYSIIKNAYNKASDKRKAILISMACQMGCYGLSQFTTTLGYMAKGDWNNASDSMFDSLWAQQTPNRVKRHAYVIKYNSCGNFCKEYN